MLTTVAKFLSLILECVSAEPAPWWSHPDSAASVDVVQIAGGEEITLDIHLHMNAAWGTGACLQAAIEESF